MLDGGGPFSVPLHLVHYDAAGAVASLTVDQKLAWKQEQNHLSWLRWLSAGTAQRSDADDLVVLLRIVGRQSPW